MRLSLLQPLRSLVVPRYVVVNLSVADKFELAIYDQFFFVIKVVDTALGSDEAASKEVVVTDSGVGDVSVDMVPETVPSTEVGVAPELSAPAPSAATLPVTD